jgi:hypothetical protein
MNKSLNVIFRYQTLFGIILIQLMALVVYQVQLVETNYYMGYRDISLSFDYIANLFLGVAVLAVIAPQRIKKPSDLLLYFYALFVIAPITFFQALGQEEGFIIFCIKIAIVSLPLILIKIGGLSKLRFKSYNIIPFKFTYYTIAIICVITLFYGALNAPASSGFNMENSYDRRLEGRDIFLAGSVGAYLISMTVNSFLPFLSFFAAQRKSVKALIFSLLSALAFFYLISVKAPFAYIFIAYGIGLLVRFNKISQIPKLALILIFILFLICIIEVIFFDYSIVSELAFRRIFSVPAQVVSHYMDMMFEDANTDWTILGGTIHPNGVTYLIGEMFYSSETNANTNALIHALASGGLFSYLAISVVLCIYYVCIDALYLYSLNPALLFIGYVYSILLTEQAATTAAVSSGIAFLTMLLLVTKNNISRATAKISQK